MNNLYLRWSLFVLVMGMLGFLSVGCVATGDGYGYGYDGEVNVGLDYYEPYNTIYYNNWGPGYRVGPFHEVGHQSDRGNRSSTHNYRSAPPSHAVPSIPSHSRSGGSRSGGNRSGSGNSRLH